jgi:hypothetical protein
VEAALGSIGKKHGRTVHSPARLGHLWKDISMLNVKGFSIGGNNREQPMKAKSTHRDQDAEAIYTIQYVAPLSCAAVGFLRQLTPRAEGRDLKKISRQRAEFSRGIDSSQESIPPEKLKIFYFYSDPEFLYFYGAQASIPPA